ncbi:MAG: TetR/AcrR family transcriptional regulator [Lachnospiraceae bacterium]|nr:TetR/AcrR family transcriptional regulator [Lachnospiraceae bacterium]
MRIVKEHDERKNEIIDTASHIFAQKGYDKTSVNDILNAIGIAKGTFYHYFKSKEEVLDAVITKATELIVERVEAVADNSGLAPEGKLLGVFMAMRIENQMEEGFLEEMHRPENALMHQKSLVSIIAVLTPILTQIVTEGIEKGVFHSEYPEQYMQIFLASATTLFDDGIFQVEPEKQEMLFLALISLLEKMLGVESGSFQKKASEYFD